MKFILIIIIFLRQVDLRFPLHVSAGAKDLISKVREHVFTSPVAIYFSVVMR